MFLLTIILLFSTNSTAQRSSQLTSELKSQIITKISQLLKDNYIYPEKGKEMGFFIQNKFRKGDYKKTTKQKSFAKQITNDLQEVCKDKHLTIEFDPQRVKELRIKSSEPTEEELQEVRKRRYESQKRNNFGFYKVEILEGNVGYLDLRSFRDTDFAVTTANGAMAFLANSDAIIIDLRKNHGGGATMYLLLASYFFDSKPVHLGTIYNRRSDSTQEFWTISEVPGKRMPDIDLYLLTSNETFSAAEEFAYDLKQLNRATLVGEDTGGGAHMVTRLVINDDLYVNMPFAGAINPITKTNWEGVGVKPNIETDVKDALQTAHLLALKKLAQKTTDTAWKEKLNSLISKTGSNKEDK